MTGTSVNKVSYAWKRKLGLKYFWCNLSPIDRCVLSGEFSARQAQREVVEIKNLEFSYWAWITPWGHFFAEILSWAEQPGTQFFSLSNLVQVSSSCAAISFQLFDIRWSSLDIVNDSKAISRIGFFRFGEINRSLFWVFSKKKKFQFFLAG